MKKLAWAANPAKNPDPEAPQRADRRRADEAAQRRERTLDELIEDDADCMSLNWKGISVPSRVRRLPSGGVAFEHEGKRYIQDVDGSVWELDSDAAGSAPISRELERQLRAGLAFELDGALDLDGW